jgi:PIN domain nuclease of toxin-antitoxin system
MGRPVLILVDTHVVVWLARDELRISATAKAAILKAREEKSGLAVSDITLLEIARLSSEGRLHFEPSLEAFLSDVERRFAVLPMTGRICVQAFSLPSNYPKDPADRIIGATALVEGLTLVTADEQIRKSRALPTIW